MVRRKGRPGSCSCSDRSNCSKARSAKPTGPTPTRWRSPGRWATGAPKAASSTAGRTCTASWVGAARSAWRRAALEIAREVGDRAAEALSLGNSGDDLYGFGRPEDALALYEEALELNRRIGHRRLVPSRLDALPRARRDRARPVRAGRSASAGSAGGDPFYRRINHRAAEAYSPGADRRTASSSGPPRRSRGLLHGRRWRDYSRVRRPPDGGHVHEPSLAEVLLGQGRQRGGGRPAAGTGPSGEAPGRSATWTCWPRT